MPERGKGTMVPTWARSWRWPPSGRWQGGGLPRRQREGRRTARRARTTASKSRHAKGPESSRGPQHKSEPAGEQRVDGRPEVVGAVRGAFAAGVMAGEPEVPPEQHIVGGIGVVALPRVAQVGWVIHRDGGEKSQVQQQANPDRQ